jgi:hypothetical protein
MWQDKVWEDFKTDFTTSTKRKNMFGKTSERMQGFCIVIFVTYLNRPDVAA